MTGSKKIKVSKSFVFVIIIVIAIVGIGVGTFFFGSMSQQKITQKTEGGFVNGIRADVYPTIPVQHPGKIIVKNMGDKSTRKLDANDVPISGKFFFSKDGKEVSYPREFDEAIPIVEVELIPTDQNGNITVPQNAQNFQTKEYGEEHKLLRFSSAPINLKGAIAK